MGWISLFLELHTLSHSLKPATTIEQHIERLIERGMKVDRQEATQWLNNVSYYRLSAYWYPAREFIPGATERSDHFVEGTTFSQVTRLYEADRKLRTLIHDGIERIEIAMRTQITEVLCLRSPDDPTAYLGNVLFKEKFNHIDWLSSIYRRLARAKKSESIKHYSRSYSGQFPLWVVAEFMDFSDISHLYSGISSLDQKQVAENLNLTIDFDRLTSAQRSKLRKSHPLASWMEQLTIIRNTCAHHSRLWNKSFIPASTTGIQSNGNLNLLPTGQSERIFGALVVMSHILRVVSPGTTWPDKVLTLITDDFLTNPIVNASSLGIPPQWDGRRI
ncbi:Abi family protein [Corynebacterium ulcerans]|uniref:Abi family protein n=1 Tax=Corynebacterium ulcerans TaxID=65058 RepID=UPI0005FEA828|nr:Abi family protein [Corynebacterium ulcerans]AKA97085.1 Hypothetical protein CUL131002_1563 [Corynebacterium ulcerans]